MLINSLYHFLKKTVQEKEVGFYLVLLLLLSVLFFSHPFLRYPYDPWFFLFNINDILYFNDDSYLTSHPHRQLWFLFWVEFFQIFPIKDIFLQAKIIHLLQVLLCLFSVYFFSLVVLRNLFLYIDKVILKYLSLWSAIIWLTIFSTFSVFYHQSWVLWYSVTHQVTISLFWYACALTFILFIERIKLWQGIYYVTQIVFLIFLMLNIHAMEIAYYFMYLILLSMLYIKKIISTIKKHYISALILIVFSSFLILYYYNLKGSLKIFSIIHDGGLSGLYQYIMKDGTILVEGKNRAAAAINELIYFSSFLLLFALLRIFLDKFKGLKETLNFRVFVFIIFSSLFIAIPLVKFTAGVASVLSDITVVNRLYYSSSLFLVIPAIVYYYFSSLKIKKITLSKINLSIFIILFSVFIFSTYGSSSQNYSKNIRSLIKSFDRSEIGFHLNKKQIIHIGALLSRYESEININKSEIIYYAREDIAMILKYVYHRNVYWDGWRKNRTLKDFNHYLKASEVYLIKTSIVFKTPEGFPDYEPFK